MNQVKLQYRIFPIIKLIEVNPMEEKMTIKNKSNNFRGQREKIRSIFFFFINTWFLGGTVGVNKKSGKININCIFLFE